MESTFAAYGISYVGPGRFRVLHPLSVPDRPKQTIKLRLERTRQSEASVKLALPAETDVFGVELGFIQGDDKHCVFTLASPSQRISIPAKQGARAFVRSTGQGHLGSVELISKCPGAYSVEFTEIWLAPSITPHWRSETESSEPRLVPIAELPAPHPRGKVLIWEPPVPLEHAAAATIQDVALAVGRAPAVVEAVGIRPGMDELEFEQSPPWALKLAQRYRFGDKLLKVDDAAIFIDLDDGYALKSIRIDKFRPGIEKPRQPQLSPQQALRILLGHKSGMTDAEPELALFGTRLVYAFDLKCNRLYVDAFDGAYTVGPNHCFGFE